MALSDAKVRNAKPRAKPYKISDRDGLYLLVAPNGSKYWRFKYRFAGKEKLLAIGVYPEVGLGDARDKQNTARKAVADGRDPAALKKEAKLVAALNESNAFEVIAWEWFEKKSAEWAKSSARTAKIRLENYLIPKLGPRPINQITAPEVLAMLREVEHRGVLDTAKRVMQTCGQVFMYAIATGRAERNPVPDLRGALKTPQTKHRAYLQEKELPPFLKKLESYDGAVQTKLAVQLLLLTFVRTLELRGAEWSEINFDKAEWRIPPERMKLNEQHIVPLSRQAIALLRELQNHSGNRQYIFPNQVGRDGFMSENTILYALYRMVVMR